MQLKGINHWYGDLKVLYDVNLAITRGQIVSLVGPSGCGKSTLLRAIVGTHPPKAGAVYVSGSAVTKPGRDRGIVYQQYALFPFLTAIENVAFGLLLDQTNFLDRTLGYFKWRALRQQHREQAAAMLEKLDLGHALDRYPHQLSGGMRQRVAIAQALIMKPSILLLDEPFGALDEATREELQDTLLDLYQENLAARAKNEPEPYTILIVTHELNEALYVADRVVGLSQYWDWQGEGLERSPGATVIYDAAAPIFEPRQPRDPEVLIDQRHEIREVVFSEAAKTSRHSHVRYWREQQQK